MKKIIAIIGTQKSPQTSNTAQLVKKFLGKLKNCNDSFQTEIIVLGEKNIQMCKGCLTCEKTGKCIIKDDLEQIRRKLRESDLIIFGSPVYISHVSATYKNFLDRMILSMHLFEFLGKPCINAVTANGSGEKPTAKYMNYADFLFGAVPLGTIIKLNNQPFEENKLNNLVNHANSILSKKSKLIPKVKNLIVFWVMKKIIMSHPSNFPYSSNYWKQNNLFKKSYRQMMKTNSS